MHIFRTPSVMPPTTPCIPPMTSCMYTSHDVMHSTHDIMYKTHGEVIHTKHVKSCMPLGTSCIHGPMHMHTGGHSLSRGKSRRRVCRASSSLNSEQHILFWKSSKFVEAQALHIFYNVWQKGRSTFVRVHKSMIFRSANRTQHPQCKFIDNRHPTLNNRYTLNRCTIISNQQMSNISGDRQLTTDN
jgi:hypothetical protein